jgi:glycosidase
MQWDLRDNAGFTPVSRGCRFPAIQSLTSRRNAKSPSMFSLYRKLIALRRREPALSIGAH